jgi:hypothetical protein
MKKLCKEFEDSCIRSFEFLIRNFGFKAGRSKSELGNCYLTFMGEAAAIKVSFVPRDRGVVVLLYRLVDGKIPPYEIFIKPETIINSFYLDNIIALRSPSTEIESNFTNIGKPTSEELESALAANADALKNHAQDILQGDFSIFPELEKIVKQRAEEMN